MIHEANEIGKELLKATELWKNYNNLSVLDKLAVDYYASGRELELQCKMPAEKDWSDYNTNTPSFSNILQWRKKPEKKQITIDIFEDIDTGGIVTAEVGEAVHFTYTTAGHWKHLKTVEVEV